MKIDSTWEIIAGVTVKVYGLSFRYFSLLAYFKNLLQESGLDLTVRGAKLDRSFDVLKPFTNFILK